jgi:ribokinase
MSNGPLVAVVGSANLDIVMSVPWFPRPGETLLGSQYREEVGGKGLNQAVAAAASGPAALVACVGDDPAGQRLLDRLQLRGVDSCRVHRTDGPTGRAFIQVAGDGENTIVVLPLANERLDAARVEDSLDALSPAVVLAQLEIVPEAVTAAAARAKAHGARFVLNASPVRPLPTTLLERCDPLVVNLVEAESFTHAPPDDSAHSGARAADLARALADIAASVVVTAGHEGAYVATRSRHPKHLPGARTHVVDTTGAGDEFAGALAAALAGGAALDDAAELANQAASRILGIPRHER